jgi:hypothetical protein
MRLLTQRILNFHWLTTFVLMGVFSFLGGAASLEHSPSNLNHSHHV